MEKSTIKTLRFFIRGNQQDRTGNPIGYTRVVKNHWRADATRYTEWKEYVRAELDRTTEIRSAQGKWEKVTVPLDKNFFPVIIGPEETITISMNIFLRDEKHADIDNILKGIMDSILKDDKCVTGIGKVETFPRSAHGMVEVFLEIKK